MKARRGVSPRVAAFVAAAVVALGFGGLAAADASQLTVSGGAMMLQNAARCTGGPIATSAGDARHGINIDALKLSYVPAACAGQTVSVVVYRSNGTSYATGSGTAVAGTFDIATTSYKSSNVSGVALLIGGWGIPTTWTDVPVVLPPVSCIELTPWTGGWPPPDTYGTPTGNTCTATITNYGAWGSPLSQFNLQFTVTGADNWELTFNFANTTQFPGFTPTNVGGNLNPRLAPGASCSDLPLLVVRKYLPWGSNTGYIEANNLGIATANQMCP